MRVALVRHTAPDIGPGLCYGRRDVGLSEAGRRSLPDLAMSLAGLPVRLVWSSPAQRCLMLAEAVARHRGLPVHRSPDLLEMDFGDWEGRAWDSVPRQQLDRWHADPLAFAAPGGESGRAFVARVSQVWERIRARDEDSIVVTHGGPLRLLLALARGRTPDLLARTPPIGSVTTIECR